MGSDTIEVTTFSPGHITGFFQICDQPTDPLLKGSRGAGISISSGVTTKVSIERSSETSIQIMINSNVVDTAEVSEHVIKTLLSGIEGNYRVFVDHNFEVPISSGYGCSGAGALSLALAINESFGLGLSRIEAAQIAHIAEVECKTGLGTVIAETYGGLEIRVKPGAPGLGEIKQIPIGDGYAVVCLNFGALPTKNFLTDEEVRRRINESGGKFVDELVTRPDPHKFMEFSRSFAECVGLISGRMRDVLREADGEGLTCSMMMFGESIFSLIKQDDVEALLKVFRKHALSENRIIVTGIDFKGARVL